ncbi:MAG: UTP--glucose-1-phosphate uridylyltransferase [Planctomycetes bacterium]|nr:UTP--glucose-1-phosphate uridylyltransferase [Planctomycetota bacterium]
MSREELLALLRKDPAVGAEVRHLVMECLVQQELKALPPEMELRLGPGHRALLDRFGFRPDRFRLQQARLRVGVAAEGNIVRGDLRPPAPEEIPSLPPAGSEERRRLEARGAGALASGEVASVILNGGMATRLGGVVKAGVEVLRGWNFLALKLADVRATEGRTGGRIPIRLMNSFATDEATDRLLELLPGGRPPGVGTFAQGVSVRLAPSGDVFAGADGHASLYAPGHGDLVEALRKGTLAELARAGVRSIVMSNVDNLAAGVDPAVVGFHLDRAAQMTVEVVRKVPGDRGGAPAWLDGRLQVIEGMRFPQAFDQDRIRVFNTNTLLFDLAAIDRDFPLDFFYVKKTVDGREAIQFERLAGQLSAWLSTAYLEVPRSGPESRFLPAKDAEEIAARRGEVEKVMRARGVIV